MENSELLYNHYKESNELSKNAQKERSHYFCGLCILEIINFVFLLYPSETVNIVTQWLNEKYSVALPSAVSVFQVALWLLIVYFTISYFQKNIYIERQYTYLSKLENVIATKTNLDCFDREGNNYNKNYPLALTLIDRFYKWVIPIAFVLINTIKIIFEYYQMINILITVLDSSCYLFTLILTVLYLKMINFNN